jgi:DNA (cytosine-5)-methyltransferase 1
MYLDMNFNYEEVPFGLVKDGVGKEVGDTEAGRWLQKVQRDDKRLADVVVREGLPEKLFTHKVFQDHNVPGTLASNGDYYRGTEKTKISCEDARNIATFPQDYQFGSDSREAWQYVCGMSVPPVMMKRVVTRLIDQGVFDYKLKGANNELL